MNTLITYKIVSDQDGKLKNAAKSACDFWNKFIMPASTIVIRLGVFTNFSSTIARAYKPCTNENIVYGRVEFNTKYLKTFTDTEIIGTIIHEIGHTLGFGWNKWMELFDHDTGEFKQGYIEQVPALDKMSVETDYGPGTRFSHWDEEKFDRELMTGFKDDFEYVLPVTIEVTSLLGHKVLESLSQKTMLVDIINDLQSIVFSRTEDARKIDRDHFIETEIWEERYSSKRISFQKMNAY